MCPLGRSVCCYVRPAGCIGSPMEFLERVAWGGAMHGACEANQPGLAGRCYWMTAWSGLLASCVHAAEPGRLAVDVQNTFAP